MVQLADGGVARLAAAPGGGGQAAPTLDSLAAQAPLNVALLVGVLGACAGVTGVALAAAAVLARRGDRVRASIPADPVPRGRSVQDVQRGLRALDRWIWGLSAASVLATGLALVAATLGVIIVGEGEMMAAAWALVSACAPLGVLAIGNGLAPLSEACARRAGALAGAGSQANELRLESPAGVAEKAAA